MATASRQRLLTIGTVCGMLKDEFPDISISKIRYLEDRGLLAPRRTQGGYRMFSEEDVERLETILRLQREEEDALGAGADEFASETAAAAAEDAVASRVSVALPEERRRISTRLGASSATRSRARS